MNWKEKKISIDWSSLIREFITLFVSIDPVGTIPVFLFAASRVPSNLHRLLAIRAVGIAGLVLLAFLAGGQVLMESLGLRLGAFEVAGGIILFLFALTMIFGESKSEAEIAAFKGDPLAGAVFPLAMPSIASPGAMLAVVVLTDNHSQSVSEQAITAGMLVVVLVFTLVLLLAASWIHRFIGNTGASVISRVMGIILATIAVDAVVGGFEGLGLLNVTS
nr:MarC family protein [Amylibacter sp.]